jgi:metal-sulfur cluster biosynthetic enzyme
MITQEAIISKLQNVYDPEIPVNIYDLGLIYDIKIIGNEIYILMTLTTATCPAAAFIPESVKNELSTIWGVKAVHVDVVYEPRWSKNKMSAKAKQVLGFA